MITTANVEKWIQDTDGREWFVSIEASGVVQNDEESLDNVVISKVVIVDENKLEYSYYSLGELKPMFPDFVVSKLENQVEEALIEEAKADAESARIEWDEIRKECEE